MGKFGNSIVSIVLLMNELLSRFKTNEFLPKTKLLIGIDENVFGLIVLTSMSSGMFTVSMFGALPNDDDDSVVNESGMVKTLKCSQPENEFGSIV